MHSTTFSVLIDRHYSSDGDVEDEVVAVCRVEDCDVLTAEFELDAEDQCDDDDTVEVVVHEEVMAELDDDDPEEYTTMHVVCERRGDFLVPVKIYDDEEQALEYVQVYEFEYSVECCVCSAGLTPVGATE